MAELNEEVFDKEDVNEDPEVNKAEAEGSSDEEVKTEETDTVNEEPKSDAEDNEGSDDAPKEKGKWKKGDKKLEALKQKNEELEDRVKRQMAEFENFRKRTEKEKSTMFEMGAKSVIEKLLPVVDNFERGLASASDDDKQDPIYEGMNLIYKQLTDELDKLGVKPIEALGTEFNPEFHNAVMQEETDEFEEGMVCKELQKGYTYRDSVVRHSMVAVAK